MLNGFYLEAMTSLRRRRLVIYVIVHGATFFLSPPQQSLIPFSLTSYSAIRFPPLFSPKYIFYAIQYHDKVSHLTVSEMY